MDVFPIASDLNPWWRHPGARPARRYPRRRDLFPVVLERVEMGDPPRATVVLGPRRVGKTVLLEQIATALLDAGLPGADLTYFNFADDRLVEAPTPRELVALSTTGHGSDRRRVFLFDEIQRVPRWNEWLKNAVDREDASFVLTGSSALTLRQGSVESGYRRWKELPMEGLSYGEFLRFNAAEGEREDEVELRMPNAFERYLAVGGLPEHATMEPSAAVRRDIREEITDKALLRELASRVDDPWKAVGLFVYFAKFSGAILNQAARARDLGVDKKSIASWTRILTDSHLVVPVDRFRSRSDGGPAKAGRVTLPMPKLYVFDHAIVSAFSETPDPQLVPDVRARMFETVVYRHLRGAVRESGAEGLFYHRRSDEKSELDFVMPLADGLVAVEVKSGKLDSRALDKLRAAAGELGTSRSILVHASRELSPRIAEGLISVRIDRFLRDPASYLMGKSQ